MERMSWENYFLEIAQVVAKRASCLRRKIGAVIVKDNRILATGYNGVPKGLQHCSERGCYRDLHAIPSGQRHELCLGLHAEQNAILQAALHGVSIKDSIIYITHQPCIICCKMIINAGIKQVIFQGDYPDALALELFAEAGTQLTQIK